jgi:hemerythrin superfamily protein
MSNDALVLLKQDHRQLRRLFQAFQRARSTQQRGRVTDSVVRLLMAHSFVEEELVHPKILELVPDLARDTLVASEEHRVADALVDQLAAMHPDDERLEATMQVLIDVVTRHIDQEEQSWMPAVRKALGRKQLQALGAEVLTAREQAPVPGPGTRLEHAVSTLLDP